MNNVARNEVVSASAPLSDALAERLQYGRTLTSGERAARVRADAVRKRMEDMDARASADAYWYRRGQFHRQSASPFPDPLQTAAGLATGAGFVAMSVPMAAHVASDMKTLGVKALDDPDTVFSAAMLGLAARTGVRSVKPAGSYRVAAMTKRRAALDKLAAAELGDVPAAETTVPEFPSEGSARLAASELAREQTAADMASKALKGMPSEAVSRDAQAAANEEQGWRDLNAKILRTEAAMERRNAKPSRVEVPEDVLQLQRQIQADDAAFRKSLRGNPRTGGVDLSKGDVFAEVNRATAPVDAPETPVSLWRRFGRGLKTVGKYGLPVSAGLAAAAYGVSAAKDRAETAAKRRDVMQARGNREAAVEAFGRFAEDPGAAYDLSDDAVSAALASPEAYEKFRTGVAAGLVKAYGAAATPETARDIREMIGRGIDRIDRRFLATDSAAVRRYDMVRRALGRQDPLSERLSDALDDYDRNTLKIGGAVDGH